MHRLISGKTLIVALLATFSVSSILVRSEAAWSGSPSSSNSGLSQPGQITRMLNGQQYNQKRSGSVIRKKRTRIIPQWKPIRDYPKGSIKKTRRNK
jgi:hypothetical protein